MPLLLTLLLTPTVEAEVYRLALEPNHSTVAFSVPIAGGMTQVGGFFRKFELEILFDTDNPSASSVQASIEAASIDTGIDARDDDLRGPTFFDVENHPKITFRSEKVAKRGDEWVATGQLTMRGVERSIDLPFKIIGGEPEDGRLSIGVHLRTEVNRLDYGIATDWRHTAIPNFLGNQIEVRIDLWTRHGKPVQEQ